MASLKWVKGWDKQIEIFVLSLQAAGQATGSDQAFQQLTGLKAITASPMPRKFIAMINENGFPEKLSL